MRIANAKINGMKVFVWADSQYPAAVEQAKERAADGIIRKPNRLSDLQGTIASVEEHYKEQRTHWADAKVARETADAEDRQEERSGSRSRAM